MQSWCRTWLRNGSRRIRAKQKLLRKHKGACKSSWSEIRDFKSKTLTIPWIWQSLWRSFLESLYFDTTQIRYKWSCRKGSAQSKGRHLCRIVAIRSEWKLVGRFHGTLYISSKYSRSLIWWEDPIWETFWETILKDRSFRLVHWLSITLPNCERPVENPSIWKESLTWLFLGYALYAGENLEGWRNGRHWGVGNDGRIWNLLEKTQCKKGDIS